MSNPYIEGDSNRGGAATNIYRARNPRSSFNTFLEQIEGKSDARQLELFGGTSGGVRHQELDSRYRAWDAAPEVLGTPKPDDAGLLIRAADYILRPAYAGMGILTGLLGLDRYADDVDNLGNHAAPSRVGTAFSRAGQAIRGEVRYNFRDFTPIARKKQQSSEPIPTYQNTLNAAGGFVVDTVFDPLTYVSFGGNLYGRRLGSRYVANRVESVADSIVAKQSFDPERFLLQTYEAGRASAITPPALAMKAEALRRQALAKNLISDPAKNALLVRTQFSVDAPIAETIAAMRRVSSGEVDFLREAARSFLPDAAAMQYWVGSARGLRHWLVRTMGMDDGMRFYKALPYDIQGGLRIRQPFVRTNEGLPIATRPIGGGGQIAEALSKRGFKQMEKMLDFTEQGRDLVRKLFFGTPGFRNVFIQGRGSGIAYDAIIAATGRVVSDGRTPFVAYRQFDQMLYANALGAGSFNTTQTSLRLMASESFGDAVKELPTEDARAVSREVFLYLSDRTRLEAHALDPSLASSDLQRRAITPALSAKLLLDNYGAEAVELGINETLLNNFAMRVKTARTRSRRQMSEDVFTPSSGGKADTLKGERNAHVFEWAYDINEGAKVARWKVAPDILEFVDGQWEHPFVTDFITSLFSYADDMTRTLDSWRLAKIAMDSGLFSSKQTQNIRHYSNSLIERDINELVGQGATPGALHKLKRDIVDNFFEGDEKLWGEFIEGAQVYNNELITNIRPNVTGVNARAFGAEMSDAGIGGIVRRETFDDYGKISDGPINRSRPKDVVETYMPAFGADGTLIELTAAGRYRLVRSASDTELVPGADAIEVSFHRSLEQAVEHAKSVNFAHRDVRYNNYISHKLFEVMENVDNLLYMNIGQAAGMPLGMNLRASRNLLQNRDYEQMGLNAHYGLWAYTEELTGLERQRAQEAIVSRAYDLVTYFGRGKVDFKLDDFGNIIQEGSARQYLRKEITDEYANWLQREAWADLRNVVYNADGTVNRKTQVTIQNRIAQRMDNVIAPRAVMDAYTRLAAVNANPDILLGSSYETLYTALRSSVTVWRGFGFVGRNILGGSYNGTLYGVGRRHFKDSAEVLMARWETRQQILNKHGESAYSDASLQQEMYDTMLANLRKRFGDRSDTYIQGRSDADALMEIWELSYEADLVGGARTSRFIGDVLLRAPYETPRSTAFDIRRPMDRRGNLARYIDPAGVYGSERFAGQVVTGRNTLADIYGDDARAARAFISGDREGARAIREEGSGNRYIRSMQWLATDNPWVSRVMGPLASTSEDYMRFAAFLKGVQTFGLEPAESGVRGFSAAYMTKLTQFDYSDLTPFELKWFKNALPFWVWTRNNVPLQVRSFIHDPSKIGRYMRGVDAFQQFFQVEHENPTPAYAQNQFSVYIDPSYWDGAPRILRPFLPKGTVGINPFPWLDPVIDVNRWFKLPSRANPSPVNWPELSNNLNPIITSFAEMIRWSSIGPDWAGRDQRDAPRWMIGLGLSSPDTKDPSQRVSPQPARQFATNFVPQLALLERYFPWFFGDERQRGRWLTTMVSAIFGIGILTLDDQQLASEKQTQIERNKHYIDRKFGPSAGFRIEMIRRLLDEGAPLWFIEAVDIGNLPESHIDVNRVVEAWKMYQGLEASFQMIEDPQAQQEFINNIVRSYNVDLNANESTSASIASGLWDYLGDMGFRGDFHEMVRAGAFQPPSNIELRTIGVTRWEIDRLFARYTNESLPQEERNEARAKLQDIHDQIVFGRESGEFTIFGEKVKDRRNDD